MFKKEGKVNKTGHTSLCVSIWCYVVLVNETGIELILFCASLEKSGKYCIGGTGYVNIKNVK
jgi:hypothetical protein